MPTPRPFSRYEFMIAWRYLRARKAEGGVSTMTWISLIGIALGVMALITTLAVRSGFRAEFVDTILGANAHVTVYMPPTQIENALTDEVYTVAGRITDYDGAAARIEALPGVVRVDPVVKGQVMATAHDRSNVAEVIGLAADDLRALGYTPVVLTAPADLPRVAPALAPAPVFSAASFEEFAAVISQMDALFTPDTAAVHVAAAYRLPVFGLYVAERPGHLNWYPYGSRYDWLITPQALPDLPYEEVWARFKAFLVGLAAE